MKVEVTERHIREAQRIRDEQRSRAEQIRGVLPYPHGKCPVSLALKDAGVQYPSMEHFSGENADGPWYISFRNRGNGSRIYVDAYVLRSNGEWDKSAAEMSEDFDAGEKIKPGIIEVRDSVFLDDPECFGNGPPAGKDERETYDAAKIVRQRRELRTDPPLTPRSRRTRNSIF